MWGSFWYDLLHITETDSNNMKGLFNVRSHSNTLFFWLKGGFVMIMSKIFGQPRESVFVLVDDCATWKCSLHVLTWFAIIVKRVVDANWMLWQKGNQVLECCKRCCVVVVAHTSHLCNTHVFVFPPRCPCVYNVDFDSSPWKHCVCLYELIA